MKIKLKDLEPNPFKKFINGGKLNPEKIEKLKESIKSDGFWSGVMCRKVEGGYYQIPFGHHRVESAKQVLGKDYVIDIPVLDLSDEQMVRMLANENSMQNEEYAIYQVDTVVMAKNYLENCPPNGQSLKQSHKKEIGVREISEFLGEKNWTKSKVAQYLRMHEQLNPALMKELKNSPNTGKVGEFTVSHATSFVKLPSEDQLKLKKEITGKDVTKREAAEIVNKIEKGSSIKEAVNKVVKNRSNKEAVRKVLAPLSGQKIFLLCDSLLRAVEENPLSTFPQKGQEALALMFQKVIKTLNKELEVK